MCACTAFSKAFLHIMFYGVYTSRRQVLSMGYRGVRGLFDISDDNNSLDNDSYYVLDKAHTKSNSGYIGLSFLF